MITALDTNVLAFLYGRAPEALLISQEVQWLASAGKLVICGVVYAELLAGPDCPKTALDAFLEAVDVGLDPDMGERVWSEAGRANADYHARRRAGGFTKGRPVLPDFLIGAHAMHRADRLYTDNAGDFGDFPTLTVVKASTR